MTSLKEIWYRSSIQWGVRTVYYFTILFALLWLYGFHETITSIFIYNEF